MTRRHAPQEEYVIDCPACGLVGGPFASAAEAVQHAGRHDDLMHRGEATTAVRPAGPPVTAGPRVPEAGDIRAVQRAVMDNKRRQRLNAVDVPLELCLLQAELAAFFQAWHARRGPATAEELADLAIHVLGLAGICGIDLQSAVAGKLALDAGCHGDRVNGVPARRRQDVKAEQAGATVVYLAYEDIDGRSAWTVRLSLDPSVPPVYLTTEHGPFNAPAARLWAAERVGVAVTDWERIRLQPTVVGEGATIRRWATLTYRAVTRPGTDPGEPTTASRPAAAGGAS
jgi:NTP pyrophosphatase (non-canonical NTP hydrolase)